MRIGVLSDGPDLSSEVSEDFGHAPFFLIVDSETLDYTVVENEFMEAEGAGMKVAQAIVDIGVEAVVVGGIGTHGFNILDKAGIDVSYDEEGSVEECVTDYIRRRERMKRFKDLQEA
ncbi:MAG: hypothetical protein E7Z67_04165 [Thermoplasmata archaeon]|nr:hypothetical protein [Thermoplasmata archaeon]